jgi:hypothetical protein
MRALKSLGSALIVGVGFSVFLVFMLGANWRFAIGSSVVLGLGIVAVVGTRPSDKDVAADSAWRAAAPDLSPASDRLAMEAAQSSMPGPEKPRRRSDRIVTGSGATGGDGASVQSRRDAKAGGPATSGPANGGPAAGQGIEDGPAR